MPSTNYKINKNGCWVFQGCITATGYSRMWDSRLRKSDWGHRVYYRHYIGDIPEGFVLDHLCRNRQCINPKHLETVTTRENVLRGVSLAANNARKTHCPRGHEYNAENSYFNKQHKNGQQRSCRICQLSFNDRTRGIPKRIKGDRRKKPISEPPKELNYSVPVPRIFA